MNIQIGQQAPDFTLYDSEKKPVSLAGQRGNNVLLLFFPLAFTSVCTKELCEVRDNIGLYNSANAVVFGISVDSPQTLARYKEDQRLNFTLLSDFNKDVSAAYDSLYEVFTYNMKGVSKRSAFIIDREGVVRYAEIMENVKETPDFAAIQKVLAELN